MKQTDKNGKPRESCGLFGVYGVENAVFCVFRGLFALQHRGQEGAGIVTSDGTNIVSHKGMGLLNEVFSGKELESLGGSLGIGHVRYSTTGSSRINNVQPIVVECVDGLWAVAHNGNLTNADSLRRMYQEAGAIFQTGTDSEVLVHMLADPMFRNRPGRVARALAELRGAFSFLLMTRDSVMAARDPFGFRPLSIGRLEGGWVFASETCALTQVGAIFERDLAPGELVVADRDGLHSATFAERPGRLAQCVFELVYFARPDSRVFGAGVHETRVRYGELLAEEHPAAADVVIPVPDSGNCAALGFSRRSGIPLDFGFIRNHYVGRTFIMPGTEGRAFSADLKLAVLPGVVKDRRVVVVDDSIVRGTTLRRRVAWLRAAGAREVHVRVSCPPTAHPCFFGIDFPTGAELAASGKSVGDVRAFIGADSLGYLGMKGLFEPFANPEDFCSACFSGEYPMRIEGMNDKQRLERHGVAVET